MTAHFGFIPSETLKSNIEKALLQAKEGSSEPMYIIRDLVSLGITDELIDTVLVQLVHMLPPSDKRETMEKLANFIKSTVHVLMKQLLSKEPNEKVLKSTEFLSQSTTLYQGQLRVGTVLPDELVAQLKHSFAEVFAGNGEAVRDALRTQFKKFSDVMIQHFMVDFTATLDLGLIKRKASQLAQSGITKALHVAIDKLVPNLSPTELQVFTKHYDALIFTA